MRLAPLLVLLTCALASAQESFTVPAAEVDRRWMEVSRLVKSPGPVHATDDQGRELVSQWAEGRIRILVPFLAAKSELKVTLKRGPATLPSMTAGADPAGFVAVKSPDREITRYYHGGWAEKHKKPFCWPLTAAGVNVLRGAPMEPRPGEAVDHPHHTGLYFAFGEVNGREYWSKLPIVPKGPPKVEAGAALVRLTAENGWGEDLVETQEVRVLNAGEAAVLDWTITLTAPNGPVVLGKDMKMAKEGAFSVRVAAGLSAKGDAPEMIVDSKGNKGEKAVRAAGAPWVHYSGTVDGKKVGVAVMNHPSSFRHPTDWHVRAYGLFAANPWIVKGENTLQKGESLALKYRVYVHGGSFEDGKVAEVYAGYAAP